MDDLTAIVITSSFLVALLIFIAAASVRARIASRNAAMVAHETPVPIPAIESDSPYHAPIESAVIPPPLPGPNVPTWYYRRLDLVGIGAIFLLFFALAVAGSVAEPENAPQITSEMLVVSIGVQFLFAGIAVACMVRRINPVAWLGLRWAGWPWLLLIAPVTVLAMWTLFAGLQFSGYMDWMERLGVERVQDTVKLLQTTTDPLVLGLMAFAAVIAAPLCEEIVFRGYLYPVAKRFAGRWVAAACSALVFSAAHGNLMALLPLFIFGCVLVLLYERTGSLWAPIAVHFAFNSATVVVQMLVRLSGVDLESLQ